MWVVDAPLETKDNSWNILDHLNRICTDRQTCYGKVKREANVSWTVTRNDSNHNTCFCREDKDQGLETGTKQWPLSQDHLSVGEQEDPIL